jgi:hypothetical protein
MAEHQEKTVGLPPIDHAGTEEHLKRLGQWFDETAKRQESWFEAGRQSIEGSSELAKISMNYYRHLSAEWRRLSLDGSKKAFELFAR